MLVSVASNSVRLHNRINGVHRMTLYNSIQQKQFRVGHDHFENDIPESAASLRPIGT